MYIYIIKKDIHVEVHGLKKDCTNILIKGKRCASHIIYIFFIVEPSSEASSSGTAALTGTGQEGNKGIIEARKYAPKPGIGLGPGLGPVLG